MGFLPWDMETIETGLVPSTNNAEGERRKLSLCVGSNRARIKGCVKREATYFSAEN